MIQHGPNFLLVMAPLECLVHDSQVQYTDEERRHYCLLSHTMEPSLYDSTYWPLHLFEESH